MRYRMRPALGCLYSPAISVTNIGVSARTFICIHSSLLSMIFGSRFLIPSSGYGRDCRISSCVIEGRLSGPGGSPSARGFWLPQWAFYMPGFLNIRFLTIYQISLSAIFSGFFSQVKSMNLLRILTRHVIILLHNALIILIAFMIFGFKFSLNLIYFLPAFFIFLLFLLSISVAVGILCTRYRDMVQLISSMLQILFFLSPILWKT